MTFVVRIFPSSPPLPSAVRTPNIIFRSVPFPSTAFAPFLFFFSLYFFLFSCFFIFRSHLFPLLSSFSFPLFRLWGLHGTDVISDSASNDMDEAYIGPINRPSWSLGQAYGQKLTSTGLLPQSTGRKEDPKWRDRSCVREDEGRGSDSIIENGLLGYRMLICLKKMHRGKTFPIWLISAF